MPTGDNSKVWDWAFKIMSALVIPLILWGVRLEVRNAVDDAQMEQLGSDLDSAKEKAAECEKTALANAAKIVELEKDLAAAADIEKEVHKNSGTLGRLEEKLNAANENLKEIKDLLRSS
jgi:hypothetical protein